MLSRVTAPAPATALRQVPHSGIREISNLAAGVPGAIRLEVGQPDFRTPDNIVEAAKRALDEGWHGYTPTAGLPSLRERLAAKLERVNEIRVPYEQVVCGVGGTGVIAAAVTSLCEAGDEVLVPDPAWPNYGLMLAAIHAVGVRYPCPAALGFLPDLDRLESLITPRTRVLLVNSPNNPTGAVYPAAVLRRLGEIAERRGLWLVSDECYDQIVLDGSVASPTALRHADPDRVIACFTMSKTYAMTGWRLGYAVAPPALVDSMVKVIEGTATGTSTITQKAAETALDGPQDRVAEMVASYRARRDLTVELLREAGLLITVPEGAFYVLADVSPSGLESRAFAQRLLGERAVAVAPGSAFGKVANGAVRISLASSEQDLREGVGRLCELVLGSR
jgi:aspartate/methionine/tyrosine aminotransferase